MTDNQTALREALEAAEECLDWIFLTQAYVRTQGTGLQPLPNGQPQLERIPLGEVRAILLSLGDKVAPVLEKVRTALAQAPQTPARVAGDAALRQQVDDLSGLIRMLCGYADKSGKIKEKALDYLKRHNLLGSPLRENAALTAPTQRDAWMPIETAPKDGTEILLYSIANEAASLKPLIASGYWMNGWLLHHAVGPSFKPTYWQPLPAAPQQGAEHKEDADGGIL